MQGHRTLAAALNKRRGLCHPCLVWSPCGSLRSCNWTVWAGLRRRTRVLYFSTSDESRRPARSARGEGDARTSPQCFRLCNQDHSESYKETMEIQSQEELS